MAIANYTQQASTFRYKTGSGLQVTATLLPAIDTDTLMFSATVDGNMFTSRQPAKHRDLQAALKAVGLQASGKTETLRRAFHEYQARKNDEFKAHWTSSLTVKNRNTVEGTTPTPEPATVAETKPEPTIIEELDFASAYAMDTASAYEVQPELPEVVVAPEVADDAAVDTNDPTPAEATVLVLIVPDDVTPETVTNTVMATLRDGTIRQLKALAKETKCPRYGRLRKDELQQALATHLGVTI